MSPVRDPQDRSVRRQQRDLAVAAREKAATPPQARPPEADPTPEDPAARTSLEEEFERLPTRERHGGRRSEQVQRQLGRLRVDERRELAQGDSALLADPATVIVLTRGQCEVELGDGSTVIAHLPKALALAQQTEVAVGDRVLLERRAAGALAVARLLPRSSRLSRPDPFYLHRERVIAANLDLAMVVTSVRKPLLSTGLLDRFLVALAHGGVPAEIVVNKVDLIDGSRDQDPELASLEQYRALGVPVHLVSASTGEGIESLRESLAGKLAVFVGHSGVGKSSVLNALDPEAAAAVGAVSESWQKGRHTTTSARIYKMAKGIRIIDTPGIREFGLWKMSPRELAAYFEEFDAVAGGCRFTDCTHTHEPHCAVSAAAARGELPRYATYLRILESLGG